MVGAASRGSQVRLASRWLVAGAPTRGAQQCSALSSASSVRWPLAVMTFFVPALFPGLGWEFFWIGWSIAPIAGILGGAVIGKLVHHIAIRRVEVAERGVKRSDLRDL